MVHTTSILMNNWCKVAAPGSRLATAFVLVAVAAFARNAMAAPRLDSTGVCDFASAQQSPGGQWYRACILPALPGFGNGQILVVERFGKDGKRDSQWGQGGMARVPAADAGVESCAGGQSARSQATVHFGRANRVLVRPGQEAQVRAFTPEGVLDTTFGEGGLGAPLCAPGESLLGAVAIDSGGFLSVSVTHDASAGSRFVSRRLDTSGRLDVNYGRSGDGVIRHQLRYKTDLLDRTVYWRIQADGDLEALYFDDSEFLTLGTESAVDGRAVLSAPGARNLGFDAVMHRLVEPTTQVLPDGPLRSSGLPILLADDTLILQTRAPQAPFWVHAFVRYHQGRRDASFGDRGFATLAPHYFSFVCHLTGTRVHHLQDDGSIVLIVEEVVGSRGGFFNLDCSSVQPYRFAMKLDPNGKLASGFPQEQDPLASGARYQSVAPTVEVVEYYNSVLDHYFMTGYVYEMDALDQGGGGPGWVRTGRSFLAWNAAATLPGAFQVCRFYGDLKSGPNSHFYGLSGKPTLAGVDECALLRELEKGVPLGQAAWRYEQMAFAIAAHDTAMNSGESIQSCSRSLVPVYRAYSNRPGDPNHRYLTSFSDYRNMIAKGWVGEGVHMCALPQ